MPVAAFEIYRFDVDQGDGNCFGLQMVNPVANTLLGMLLLVVFRCDNAAFCILMVPYIEKRLVMMPTLSSRMALY